jgi:hypothetical protein
LEVTATSIFGKRQPVTQPKLAVSIAFIRDAAQCCRGDHWVVRSGGLTDGR